MTSCNAGATIRMMFYCFSYVFFMVLLWTAMDAPIDSYGFSCRSILLFPGVFLWLLMDSLMGIPMDCYGYCNGLLWVFLWVPMGLDTCTGACELYRWMSIFYQCMC